MIRTGRAEYPNTSLLRDCIDTDVEETAQVIYLKLVTVAIAVTIAPVLHADTALVGSATVERARITDGGEFGGCMVRLDKPLADFGLNCPSRWVTFGCSGAFASREVAYRMFDLAQMAFSLGFRVSVFVDDARKLDGYCYASRIDVHR